MLGLGFSEYIPHILYTCVILVSFLSVFYRSELGILFIASMLPIYSALNKTIQSDLPFAKDSIDILVIAMLLGWMLQGNKHQTTFERSPQLLPIFVFMGYSGVSFLLGSEYLGSSTFDAIGVQRLADWKNYMLMPVLYFIAYRNLTDRKWKYALFILLFFSFLLMDYKFHITFRWVKHTHFMDKSRLGGTLAFLGPNEWGAFHTIYTLFLIGLFFVDKNLWRRIPYAILIVCNTYSLMYSFSRGAYIGFAVGLLAIGIVKSRLLLAAIVIFFFLWHSVLPLAVVERIQGTFVEQGERTDVVSVAGANLETANRTEVWKTAFDLFLKNPVVGTGYDTHERMTGWDTHNAYLKAMVEQGIIGLLIFLWLYMRALQSGWSLYRRGTEELVRAFGFAFCCAVVGSMVVNFFGDRWSYLQLGGLYWIFWALVDQENAKIAARSGGAAQRNTDDLLSAKRSLRFRSAKRETKLTAD